uniref:50S ribosomal protein L14, chloroplastic n=1 Tax=Prosopanche americana TaxID=29816 RepID=A0A6H0DSS1_PROAM|nr:ribosomal protein L14 [Prosopanche americana]
MIKKQTYLNVTDNSGAIKLMCIQKLGISKFKSAYIGDIVISVIKEALPNVSIEKSEIIRAVIVRTRKEIKRSDGIILKFDDNAAVVIDKLNNPKGSRIFGVITHELRKLNFNKIISLSSEIF